MLQELRSSTCRTTWLEQRVHWKILRNSIYQNKRSKIGVMQWRALETKAQGFAYSCKGSGSH